MLLEQCEQSKGHVQFLEFSVCSMSKETTVDIGLPRRTTGLLSRPQYF